MKRIRHTAAQIIRKLKSAEPLIALGTTIADVCCGDEVNHDDLTPFCGAEQRGGTTH